MWRDRVTLFHWILLVSAGLAVAIWVTSSGALRWVLLSVLCSGSGLWVGLGVSFPRLQMFGKSLCSFQTDRKAVALTFDDGPDPKTTPAVLDILAERNALATFFCVGRKAQQYPELVRRIANEGHQVENHSYGHSHVTNFFSVKRLRAELEQTQRTIVSATGKTPTLFRPPMGLTNQRVFKAARAMGLQVAGYTVRAFDRRSDSPEEIGLRLARKAQPGSILLLHDSGVPAERAKAVLKCVLDELTSRGFECVTMDQLSRHGAKPSIAPFGQPR